MNRALQLARLGIGRVAPNPAVGAVVVHNGRIIGEGYHKQYGGPHAEVNAIAQVADKALLHQSTLYVTLEPCAHHGKTPPCADLIVQCNIPRVVIGHPDPFAKVNGLGIARLKNAGIEVTVGVLQAECRQLMSDFLTFHTHQRPYIILKWAQTADGFIDKIRTTPLNEPQPNWITNEVCRTLVHKWRTQVQAIMVGTNTALYDNPKLNVRNWQGRAPLRLVTDTQLRLPKTLALFDQSIPTLVINHLKTEQLPNLEYVKFDANQSFFDQLMMLLYERNIASLFVEGGAQLLQSFINHNRWDEARVFNGAIRFGNGIKAPDIAGNVVHQMVFDNNQLTIYKPIL